MAEKSIARDQSKFGTGEPRGVAAPEAGNNAAAGGALVPMLTLGVPGSGTTAVLFVYPNGQELLGETMWLRVEEIDGMRILNHQIVAHE